MSQGGERQSVSDEDRATLAGRFPLTHGSKALALEGLRGFRSLEDIAGDLDISQERVVGIGVVARRALSDKPDIWEVVIGTEE